MSYCFSFQLLPLPEQVMDSFETVQMIGQQLACCQALKVYYMSQSGFMCSA